MQVGWSVKLQQIEGDIYYFECDTVMSNVDAVTSDKRGCVSKAAAAAVCWRVLDCRDQRRELVPERVHVLIGA